MPPGRAPKLQLTSRSWQVPPIDGEEACCGTGAELSLEMYHDAGIGDGALIRVEPGHESTTTGDDISGDFWLTGYFVDALSCLGAVLSRCHPNSDKHLVSWSKRGQ